MRRAGRSIGGFLDIVGIVRSELKSCSSNFVRREGSVCCCCFQLMLFIISPSLLFLIMMIIIPFVYLEWWCDNGRTRYRSACLPLIEKQRWVVVRWFEVFSWLLFKEEWLKVFFACILRVVVIFLLLLLLNCLFSKVLLRSCNSRCSNSSC